MSEPDAVAVKQPDHSEAVQVAVTRLTRFARAHGGAKFAYVEYVSANRTRLVVVASDGRWGDQVLPSYEAARQVGVKAGFDLLEGEWEREAVGAVRTTGYEWGRMGRGRAAGQ